MVTMPLFLLSVIIETTNQTISGSSQIKVLLHKFYSVETMVMSSVIIKIYFFYELFDCVL